MLHIEISVDTATGKVGKSRGLTSETFFFRFVFMNLYWLYIVCLIFNGIGCFFSCLPDAPVSIGVTWCGGGGGMPPQYYLYLGY